MKIIGSRSRSNFKVKVNFQVWTITFECLKLQASFLAYRYIFTISRSGSHIKVIGSMSRSNFKVKVNLEDYPITFECIKLQT